MQFVSDLHLELRKPKHAKMIARQIMQYKPRGAFMLALLGDIGYRSHMWDLLETLHSSYKHIVYVLGNHEGYKKCRTLEEAHDAAKALQQDFPNLYVLEKQILTSKKIPELCGVTLTVIPHSL